MLLLLLLMADLDDVAFLTGHWQNDTTEEHWIAPKGHLMLGVGRTVKDRNSSFEFLRIENRKEGVVYVAMPNGRDSTEFKWVGGTKGKEAVFENLAHDFPQRIKYWLDDKGKLHARVEDKNGKKGEEVVYSPLK